MLMLKFDLKYIYSKAQESQCRVFYWYYACDIIFNILWCMVRKFHKFRGMIMHKVVLKANW